MRFAICTALWLVSIRAWGASLELRFIHNWDAAPLRLNSQPTYALPSGETLAISRLSYLLSGLALERSEGGWVELTNQFAWIDAERGRAAWSLESVPAGQYRALRFAVGLDPKTNEGDPAQYPAAHALNPNLNGLHWSWQGGYIFLALEGRFPKAGELTGFSYHLARNTNRTVVTLPVELNFASDDKTFARTPSGQSSVKPPAAAVSVAFDVLALLNGPRPISPGRDGLATHSRDGDALAAALRANLPSAFQIREVVNGAGRDVAAGAEAARRAPLYLPVKYTPYSFRMSAKFPVPDLPADNPLLVERVELGERLFNEPRLSRNGKLSCATCHDSEHAFADPRRYSFGVDGRPGRRNAMPLFNLAWKSSFFWDGRAPSLRAQALMPIQDHLEMDETLTNVCAKLGSTNVSATPVSAGAQSPAVPDYPALFARAFGSREITPEKIGLAIENYLLTLTSFDSKFDRAMRGEAELTQTEKRGFELFFTEYDPRTGQYGADCFHCHGGALFTDNQFHNNGIGPRPGPPPPPPRRASIGTRNSTATPTVASSPPAAQEERAGLPSGGPAKEGERRPFTGSQPDAMAPPPPPPFSPEDGPGPEPPDPGRFKVTDREADLGKFATPSLRNVALTAPYMHDGRFTTLEEVVQHYCTGVHPSPTLDPNLAKHPDGGLPLSAQDQKALVAFLKTLTDEKYSQ